MVRSGRVLAAARLAVWCATSVAPAQTPPGQTPAAGEPARAAQRPTPPTAPAGPRRVGTSDSGGFMLENVSLAELIDIVARRLKINYLLDPRFKGGSVTIHTYGEMKTTDLLPLLETILRVNGAALVKIGDLYRVVPVDRVAQAPLPPVVN